MKQKKRRRGFTSLLLAFAMVIGLLSGPVFAGQTAQAAEEDNIELGTLVNHGTYYTYPDATIQMSDTSKYFYDLSITVDSGYFKIPQGSMNAKKAMGILSDGTVADYMGSDDKYVEVSVDKQYSTIIFSWEDSQKITKDMLEAFISRIQFVTTESSSQVVSIAATTLKSSDKNITVDGKEVELEYFNGHFYGYVYYMSGGKLWSDAYQLCKKATFGGVNGYLATLTSRAEDRFIFTNWALTSGDSNGTGKGWIGCTRAKPAANSAYDAATFTWQEPLAQFNESKNNNTLETDFAWQWACGPEAGDEFGYQNHAWGESGWNGDGGFVTDEGVFSNWGNEAGNVEPNGGAGTGNEAFGYYGEYPEGRWNDHPCDTNHGDSYKSFYIEFGGYPGDDETFNENLGDQIYTVTKDSADDSNDPIPDGTEGRKSLRGDVEILNQDPYGYTVAGSPLYADIADILSENKEWNLDPNSDLSYQWYIQENEGVPEPIPGADAQTYRIKDEDLGKKIIVWVTVEKEDENGETQKYTAKSSPLDTSKKGKVEIGGDVVIEKTGEDDNGDPILKANVDQVTPGGVQPVLDYQWYIYNPEADNPYTPIPGATESTYTVPEENQGKQLVVTVTPNEDMEAEGYEGAVTSVPYKVVEKDSTKKPISGVVKIENKTLDDDGEPINKVGTVLSADITGIIPGEAQPTLTYQWYETDDNGILLPIAGATDPNYVLTENDIDRQLAVIVTADEVNYTGEVPSLPYSATRTNADISVDPDPGVDPGDGKRIIKVTPTAESTGYTVWEFITQEIPEDLYVTDKDGNELTRDDEGYYFTAPGEEIWFYVDKDKAYDIKERQIIHSNTETLGTKIEDPKVEYDPVSDTITITVDPAKPDYQYAVLKKIDGVYQPVQITRDEDGTYYPDSNSTAQWSDGEQDVVTFTKLPADGTYRIVAIPTEKTADGREPDDIDPSGILDGSKEIDGSDIKGGVEGMPIDDDPKTSYDKNTDTITITVDPAKTDYQYAVLKKVNGEYQPVTVTIDSNGNYVYDEKGTTIWSTGDQGVVTYTKLPADGTYRIVAIPVGAGSDVKAGTQTNGSKDIDGSKVKQDALAAQNTGTNTNTAQQFTKAQEDKAEAFIKSYVTDSKNKLITKVDDSTKDIILSGEATWKKMTTAEKAAVNAKLKAKGCPYTYEQLLAMAKKWKIPSFNMRKIMQKKTKSKVKMVKCSGATIITTTSNKKVATISKKGVISAKKVGKANLTITAIKGKYTNRLTIRLIVKKKFKNAKELKKLKAKQIKTPTLLLNKQRKLNKSTKIGIVDLEKKSKVTYKSLNKKNFTINKKGRYTAKKLGSSLIRTTVKQNNKTYILYLYLTGIK